MKKRLSFFVVLLLSVLSAAAQTTKSIQLTYNASDFTLEIENGLTYIDSDVHDIYFLSDTLKPALPHITVNVLIEPSQTYISHSYQQTQQMISYYALIAPNTYEINDTMTINIPSEPTSFSYTATYPASNVEYLGEEMIDGAKLLVFDICPFKYYGKNLSLAILSSITLNISLSDDRTRTGDSGTMLNNMYSIVSDIIANPEDLNNTSYAPPYGPITIEPLSIDGYEYVIVTTNAMKSEFQRLADWKTQKGIKSKVITVEEIDAQYSQYSPQELRIKYALKDYYNGQYHNLRYAILAGSFFNIPSPLCYVRYSIYVDTPPTDWFYGCFDTMDWDPNNNGEWGELSDNVDLYPEIFITRLPARGVQEAQSMVDKIIEYESNPNCTSWNNSILMGGAKLHKIRNNTSDSEYRGEKLYNKYIQPYWNGTRVKFYDTGTSFAGGANFQFTDTNLQNILSQGYPFVSIYTHGSANHWKMEIGNSYNFSDIQQLNNPLHTIITANACYTNQIDTLCMGESFLKEANSGVIGVFASSRYHYSCVMYKKLSSGNEFVGDFYKSLFTSDNKNFGYATTMAKIQNLGRCKHPFIYGTRNALYSFNALGDAEMPVYTQNPALFTNVVATLSNNQLSVSSGLSGCSICVMSKNDNGGQFYCVVRDVSNYTFDLSNTMASEFVITITKPEYVAFVTEVTKPQENNIYIQNQTFTSSATINGDNIYIGRDVTNTQPEGNVNVSGGTLTVHGNNKVVIKNGFKVNLGGQLIIN